SSRRLHTRSKRDWSSDVCSSDLMTLATNDEEIVDAEVVEDFNVDDVLKPRPVREVEVYVEDSLERAVRLTREAWARKDAAAVEEIGRASCRGGGGVGDREVWMAA